MALQMRPACLSLSSTSVCAVPVGPPESLIPYAEWYFCYLAPRNVLLRSIYLVSECVADASRTLLAIGSSSQ